MTLPDLVCTSCGSTVEVATLAWVCPCGGLYDVVTQPAELAFTDAQRARNSLWRYESMLPVPFDDQVSMGEGNSPMAQSTRAPNIRLKLDFLMPTLSFKDRGAAVLATLAARLGVRSALTDSSGNAGTAAAAYFGRAQIRCRVYVPESTSPAKLAQMRAHGADVITVAGSRADTAAAARAAAAAPGMFYASHVYHPYFLHGVKTYGYEIWEQAGHRLPDTVVVPVGNGTLALGCYLAFRELTAAGQVSRMPTIVGVQARGCAPVADAFRRGLHDAPAVPPGHTVADGIAISDPPRGAQVLAAIRQTGGLVVDVSDADIIAARNELAADGFYVEPTSAVCWAAARTPNPAQDLLRSTNVIIPMCGAGLKFSR